MSLESAIEKMTAALEANTAALGAGGGSGTTAKKPAAKPAAKKPAARKPAAKKGPTIDSVAEAFGEYLKTGDKGTRDEAKVHVKAIIDYLETDRIGNLDPAQFQEALDLLAVYVAGDSPFDDGEEGGDDGDLM